MPATGTTNPYAFTFVDVPHGAQSASFLSGSSATIELQVAKCLLVSNANMLFSLDGLLSMSTAPQMYWPKDVPLNFYTDSDHRYLHVSGSGTNGEIWTCYMTHESL